MLPLLPSRLLAAYYNAPDHPAKIRIFNYLHALLGRPRFTLPYANGGLITVDIDDLVARSILATGAYEPEVWAALSPYVLPGATVWDCGAHIGSFAIRAALDARVAAVHAFEPSPDILPILRHNVALNERNIRVHDVALGRSAGDVFFQPAPKANTGIGRVTSSGGMRVRSTSVDDLVFGASALPSPDVMKIDVEDHELRLLEGAQRLLRERPPRAIAIETRWPECEERGVLEACGYRVTHIRRPDGHEEERENLLAVLQ